MQQDIPAEFPGCNWSTAQIRGKSTGKEMFASEPAMFGSLKS